MFPLVNTDTAFPIRANPQGRQPGNVWKLNGTSAFRYGTKVDGPVTSRPLVVQPSPSLPLDFPPLSASFFLFFVPNFSLSP